MSEKWTNGPWSYNIIGDKHIYSTYGDMPVICSSPLRLQNNKTWQANAKLIAAAPELYNALDVLSKVCEDEGIPCDAAKAALAKARGEE